MEPQGYLPSFPEDLEGIVKSKELGTSNRKKKQNCFYLRRPHFIIPSSWHDGRNCSVVVRALRSIFQPILHWNRWLSFFQMSKLRSTIKWGRNFRSTILYFLDVAPNHVGHEIVDFVDTKNHVLYMYRVCAWHSRLPL